MRRPAIRRLQVSPHRALAWLVFGLAIMSWAAWLRPTWLGGPAGYVVVAGDSMLPTLSDGTLVVTQTMAAYHVGDVVAFVVDIGSPRGRPVVIHRVVDGNAVEGFTTSGDNRPFDDPWLVGAEDILGREAFAVPWAGQFLLWMRSPIAVASASAGLAAYVVLGWSGSIRPSRASVRSPRAGMP